MREIALYPKQDKAALLDILGEAITDLKEALMRLGFLYAERTRIEVQVFENSETTSISGRQREAEVAARPIIEETYRFEALRDSFLAEIEYLKILISCP